MHLHLDIIIEETAGAIMTTVYIDVLFIVNMIMDVMVHTSACIFRRKRIIIWRLLCASAAEAVCALGLFFASEWVVLYYAFALVLYIVCIWFVMGYVDPVDLIKNIIAVILCAVVFGGIFFLIYRYADFGSIMVFNNHILYIDIPIFGLLCVSGLCLGIIVLLSKAFVRVIASASEYEVCVQIFNNKKTAKAKVDTGNDLKDPVSGNPVLLVNQDWLKDFLPGSIDSFISCGNIDAIDEKFLGRLRMIYCKTATGTGILPAIRPDCIQFTYNGNLVTIQNVLIAVSKTKVYHYDLLLTPNIFKEIEHDTSTDK